MTKLFPRRFAQVGVVKNLYVCATIGDTLRVAYLRKHKRSPFWYLVRRNLDTGKWEPSSTGFRRDSTADTRKAQRLAEKISIDEKRVGPPDTSPAFAAWVPRYLATHWKREGDSRRRYSVAWQAIKAFLKHSGIIYPRQIKYAHGEAYMEWRMRTKVHDRKVGHNTALLELKFLSQLMSEAIRNDFAESNPLAKLGILRRAAKVKPELTDEQIATMRARLATEPEWMRVAFEISLYTGCRFSECSIPIENLDFATGSIRLRDSKRQESDDRKYFTVPMHPKLRPLLESLRDRGATVTCKLSADKNGRINSVFKAAKIPASFHSLRVTFITRCHRGGLTESEAMRLSNHSSALVHRIYSRLNVEDVRLVQGKIPLP